MSAPGVQYHVFDSAAVGQPVSFHIFLPPQYFPEPQRRFPVLYWLHGSGGQQTGVAPMAQRLAAAIGEGHLPPMITVFPNGLPNGMWVNAASGLQPVESMLVDDLITHVDTNFRTISMPAGRMLDGFSMGGYGAARLGLRYSHRFAGFSMTGAGPLQLDFLEDSPDFAPLETRRALLGQVYGDDPAFFAAESPLMLSALHGPDLPTGYPIRQVIGTADSILRTNREFHAHLQQLDIPHQYVEVDGIGHDIVGTMNSMGPEFWRFHRETLFASSLSADMVIDVPTDQTRTQRQAGYTFLSGTTPLMKTGGGTLVLDTANPYSGVAAVLDGVLAITSTGAIASSSLINTSAGASLDVSGLSGGYTVSSGQTLAGSGTVMGSVIFGAGSTLSPGMFSTTSGASMSAADMQASSLQALVVPEPTTVGLVGAGLGVLGIGALRRKWVG